MLSLTLASSCYKIINGIFHQTYCVFHSGWVLSIMHSCLKIQNKYLNSNQRFMVNCYKRNVINDKFGEIVRARFEVRGNVYCKTL